MRRALTALLLAVPLVGAGGATASAAITQSQLTAPADGLRVTATGDPLDVPVTGTATGGAAGDFVNLFCFTRPGSAVLAGSATVGDDGTSLTGTASIGGLRGPCVLRAVPQEFVVASGDPAPFAGPLVTVEAQRTIVLDGNNGQATGVDDWLQQTAAGVGVCSLGSSGLCGGRLFDAAARRNTEPVFNAGGWIGQTTGTRSYVQVDGVNAYPPARASQIGFGNPGLLGLTRTTARAGDGSVTTVETDPLLACNTQAFPPADQCTAFTDTGVRYERTTVVAADGTTIEQRDVLVSADGRAHGVSVNLGQNVLVDVAIVPALGFGWLRGDVPAPRQAGTELGGPTSGPATITVASSSTAPDGDPTYAHGAVTFDRPPASVRVTSPTDLLVRFPDVAVPAGGRADVVRSTYVLTRTAGAARARATALEDRLVPPTVAFSSPKADATVLTPTVTVVGTAADNVAVGSVTVQGKAAAVSATGRFSAAVPVQKGVNTITAVATDGAGNRTTATLKVTYQDRIAPAVGPLYLVPRVWRVGRTTRVGFSLGEAGTLRLTASRVVGGRRRAGVCVPVTPALRRAGAKVCVRYVKLATVIEPRREGTVTTLIGPKTGGRRLTPGRIQLRATVTDYAGNVSRPRTFDVTLRPALPRRP